MVHISSILTGDTSNLFIKNNDRKQLKNNSSGAQIATDKEKTERKLLQKELTPTTELGAAHKHAVTKSDDG